MGLFAEEADLYEYHKVTLQFRDKLMGGIPRDPKMIEGWMRSKAGVTSDTEEMRQALLRTLTELGVDVTPDMTFEEITEASEALAGSKATNGFKVDDGGLYIEGRQIKAAIKESVNIHFAGDRWGKTKKGPKSYTAERVFVLEDKIYLDRSEPDGIDLVIGHVTGPQGPRSTLSYHEYVGQPTISFHVMQARQVQEKDRAPSLKREQWAVIWTSAEENGIGALRSQGHGRFDVVEYEAVPASEVPTPGIDATTTFSLVEQAS